MFPQKGDSMKSYFAVLCAVLLVLGCSVRDHDGTRSNPFDAQSDDFRYNQAPDSLDFPPSSFVWQNFDHQDSTGDLLISVVAGDPNLPYDTLTYKVFVGNAANNLDSVYYGRSPQILYSNAKIGRPVFFRVVVTDMFDSTLDTTGSFQLPKTLPPQSPVLDIDFNSSSVQLSWSCISNASGYYVYRAPSRNGPYSPVDTSTGYCSYSRSFYDYVPDYKHYYYSVAAFNGSGQSVSKDTLEGRRYYSSLSRPTSVYASDGSYSEFIEVSWYRPSYSYTITGYYIYRAEKSSGPYHRIDSVSLTSNTTYRDSVTTSKTYYYCVASYDSQKRASDLSSTNSGYISGPSGPNYVYASNSSGYINVSWSSVSNASKYYIYRSSSYYSSYTKIDSTTSTSYKDSNVQVATTYYYKVSVRGTSGIESSPSSDYASGRLERLSQPSYVRASDSLDTHILVSWNSLSGASSYNVYRKAPDSTTYMKIATVSATSYPDSSAKSQTSYQYRVAGVDALGYEGGLSSSATGFREILKKPQNITATDGSRPSDILVDWSPVTGANGYIVYRATIFAVGAFSPVDTVKTAYYLDSDINSGARYYYTVAAKNEDGVGPQSNTVSGRSMHPPSLQISAHAYYIHVYGFCTSFADSYYVFRADSADGSYTKIAAVDTCSFRDSTDDLHTYYYKVKAKNNRGVSGFSESEHAARYVPVPTGLDPVSGKGVVHLTWNSLKDIDSFTVYRWVNTNNVEVLDTITDTTYVDTLSSVYYYAVAAIFHGITGAKCYRVVGRPGELPSVPTGFTVSGYYTHVQLSWGLPSGTPVGYYIYRGTSPDNVSLIDSTTQRSYNDYNCPEDSVWYRVAGYNLVGIGDSTLPGAGRLAPASYPPMFTVLSGRYGDRIPMSWRSESKAHKYVIFRGLTYQGAAPIDTITDTSYVDSAVHTDSLYYYAIASYDSVRGTGVRSVAQQARVLQPPVEVTAFGAQGYIRVYWQPPVTSTLKYLLYRYKVSDSSRVLVDTLTTPAINDTVPTADLYFYRASSFYMSESEVSSPSAAAQLLAPDIPSGIQATEGLEDSILVTWSAATGARAYKLYRDTDSLFSSPVQIDSTSDTTVADEVTSDSIYYYRVKSYTAGMESNLSAQVSGYRAQTAVPSAPDSVNASDTLSSAIKITWKQPVSIPPVVTGYRVYRSRTESGTYELIATVSGFEWIDPVPASFPTGYWYKVAATNEAGEGTRSTAVQGFRGKPQ